MDNESNSIQNQKKILQKAAKDKGYSDTIFFVDDGITGTTMKRPGFQKMITAIEAGYISAVFVKDLSRLGRNYIEVGKLTEEFFPLHDVRLVAVSDGVDSDEGEDDFTPFKNIMNEYYAKDISKKRRIVNKMKGNAGIPLSPPPYGYIKNPDDPRFWVVDQAADALVSAIASAVNLVDVDTVLLGGLWTHFGDELATVLEGRLRSEILGYPNVKIRVFVPPVALHPSLYGAAEMGLRRFIENPLGYMGEK